MADDIDVANDLIDNEVSRALNKIRQMTGKNSLGADFCTECGDAVPEVRRKLGFSLCVPCAQERERKKQLFAE